jgi:hypothetical protein
VATTVSPRMQKLVLKLHRRMGHASLENTDIADGYGERTQNRRRSPIPRRQAHPNSELRSLQSLAAERRERYPDHRPWHVLPASILNATYWDHAMGHFIDVRGHVPNKVLGDRSPMQVIAQRTTNVGNRYK